MNEQDVEPKYKYRIHFVCGCVIFASEDGEDKGYWLGDCTYGHKTIGQLEDWIRKEKYYNERNRCKTYL